VPSSAVTAVIGRVALNSSHLLTTRGEVGFDFPYFQRFYPFDKLRMKFVEVERNSFHSFHNGEMSFGSILQQEGISPL